MRPIREAIPIDQLYTVTEASQALGLKSNDWVYERIRSGEITYVDLNPNGTKPKYRIRASTINEIIELYTCERNAA